MSDPTIPAGMKPYGPAHPDYPNAPRDWDGGAYLCRDGETYILRGYGWAHGMNCTNPTADWDRIAYTPALSTPTTPDEAAGLRETLHAIAEGDVPRPEGKKWRADEQPSKLDQCIHDVAMYEDCPRCIEDFARAALKGER